MRYQEEQNILDNLKRGLVTDNGLEYLWKWDSISFLTELMLNFELFLPMTDSAESNQHYLIPCMLPTKENKNDTEEKGRLYLYDALQEAECGDWFKVGEFDKLLAVFARLPGWTLCKEPYPYYGCAHLKSTQEALYVKLSLEGRITDDKIKEDNPLFRVAMYCTKNTIKKDTQDIFRSFTQLIGELRKVKKILHDRMGIINIKNKPKNSRCCAPIMIPSKMKVQLFSRLKKKKMVL